MIEIFVLAAWVTLWLNPRWAILNKAGIVLLLIMAPSAVVVWLVRPEVFRTLLYWWTAYLALYLVVASAVISWRIRDDRRRAADSQLSTQAWSPIIASVLPRIAKTIAPIALFFAVAMTIILAVRGGENAIRNGLIFAALGVFGPIAPFAYLWLATRIADLLTALKPPAN